MVKRKLTLTHNGQVLRVPVRFDSANHIAEYTDRTNSCIRLELAMKKTPTEDLANLYGKAVMELYALIFGQQWANTIESFYGNDALDMVKDVNTFINTHVHPDIRTQSVKRMEQMRRDFIHARKAAQRAAAH